MSLAHGSKTLRSRSKRIEWDRQVALGGAAETILLGLLGTGRQKWRWPKLKPDWHSRSRTWRL